MVVAAVLMAMSARPLLARAGQSRHIVTRALAERGSCVLGEAPDSAIPQAAHALPAPDDVAGFISPALADAPALSPLQSPACVRAPPAL
jgi:hypothetical protein